MKIITLLSSILIISLLQGCAGLGQPYSSTGKNMPKQSLATPIESTTQTLLIKQPSPVPSQSSNGDTPQNLNEARIIKELNNAGCTISSFEMNRNKQNIRIICADSIQQSDFSI